MMFHNIYVLHTPSYQKLSLVSQLHISGLTKRPISGSLTPHVLDDGFEVRYALVFLVYRLLYSPLVFYELLLVLFLKAFLLTIELGSKISVLFL